MVSKAQDAKILTSKLSRYGATCSCSRFIPADCLRHEFCGRCWKFLRSLVTIVSGSVRYCNECEIWKILFELWVINTSHYVSCGTLDVRWLSARNV